MSKFSSKALVGSYEHVLKLVHAKLVLLYVSTLAVSLHKTSIFFRTITKYRIQLLEDIPVLL